MSVNSEEPAITERCFMCKQYTRFFVNVIKGKSRYSNRRLIDLIEHISNVQVNYWSVICQICYIKLQNFDEFSEKAHRLEIELKNLLDDEKKAIHPLFRKIKLEINDEGTEKDEESSNFDFNESIEFKPFKARQIYPCDHPNCEKIFDTRSKLTAHQTFHTNKRNFQCEICNKFYKTRVCLRSHMRIHRSNRRVICDMCGESFTTKQSVMRHFTTSHLKLRPFICQYCGANFGTSVILRLHLMTHGDGSNKNFACDICPSRFYSRSKLNRHMRGHGEKQFECEICHRKYTQRYNLNAHIRAVHGDENVQTVQAPKRFVCHLCGSCFFRHQELEQHQRSYHEMS